MYFCQCQTVVYNGWQGLTFMLLDALNDRWRIDPPDHPVIAAGSTGSIPSTARLLARIAALPRGVAVEMEAVMALEGDR